MASVSFSHFGVMKYQIPAPAPGRVTPRMRRITSTTYGNVAVKYTTCKNRHSGAGMSRRTRCDRRSIREAERDLHPDTRPHGLFFPKLFQDGGCNKGTVTKDESVRARNKVSRGISKAVGVSQKWVTP